MEALSSRRFWQTHYYPDPTITFHLPIRLIHGTTPMGFGGCLSIFVLGFKLAEACDEAAHERIHGGYRYEVELQVVGCV